MSEIALIFLLVLLIILIFSVGPEIVNRYRLKWKIQSLGMPSFKGHPFLGNLYQLTGYFGRNNKFSYSVYINQGAHGLLKTFGSDLVYTSMGMTSYVAFFKARSVEALLSDTKEINKTPDYDFTKPWLGLGLITVGRDNWKKQRKMLTPTFHFRILEQFHPIMREQADILVGKFRSGAGKDFIYIDNLVSDCTFDMIAETAFGVKSGAQSKEGSPIVEAVNNVGSAIFERLLSPWLWPEFLYWATPSGRTFYQNLDVIHTYVRKIIKEKKAELTKEAEKGGFDDENAPTKCRAFLELLLLHNLKNKDNQLTDQQIEDEVNTFNFAGFDTTAVSITWILYMLGLHPDVQKRVQKELDDIFLGDTQRLVTLEDIKTMVYLERVIKETQRLFPAVPFIARILQDEFTVCGVTLPKGSTCIVPLTCLHRDPEAFPNPEIFDPDRFLDTNRHPYAFVPFSAGPRNCIGQKFAMMEIKTVIASLLRKFNVTSLDPRDKVLISPEMTSRPHSPIRLKVELRNFV